MRSPEKCIYRWKCVFVTRYVFLKTHCCLYFVYYSSPLDKRHCIFTWAFIVRFNWSSKAIFHFPKIISLCLQKTPLCHSARSRVAKSQNPISKEDNPSPSTKLEPLQTVIEGVTTLHCQIPHPSWLAPSPWGRRVNTDYKTIGFCNSGRKLCVQNDSNCDWVTLKIQPNPTFMGWPDLWKF